MQPVALVVVSILSATGGALLMWLRRRKYLDSVTRLAAVGAWRFFHIEGDEPEGLGKIERTLHEFAKKHRIHVAEPVAFRVDTLSDGKTQVGRWSVGVLLEGKEV